MSIPGGRYMVRGIKGSEQYGRTESGTPQIGIDLEVTGGELEGTTMTTILYFSEKAQAFSVDRLRALGWKGDDLANLDGIDSEEATAIVKYETYNGKESMKVDILTGGGGRMKFRTQMSDTEKRQFAATMKPVVAQSKANGTGGAVKGDDFPANYGAAPKF